MPKAKQGPAIQFRDLAIERQLSARAEAGESQGAVAKEQLTRYFRILRLELAAAALTIAELEALQAATISRKFDTDSAPALDMSLADSFEAGELPAEWTEERVLQLVAKLQRLTYAQQWAVVDWLERQRLGDNS